MRSLVIAGGTLMGAIAILRQNPVTEAFEPEVDVLVWSIMKRVREKGVRLAPGGVKDVRIIDASVDPPEQDSMFGLLFGARPSFAVTARFRLEFVLRGGDIVRSHVITIRGHGETRGNALQDARQGMREVIDGVQARV